MGYIEHNHRRKEEIENELLALMQEIPYEQITVKDLTERMHFARKTFYHYFPSKQACLESLTDRLISECSLNQMQNLPEDAGLYQIYEERLKFWMEHKAFLDAVNRNKLGSFWLNRFLKYIHQEDQNIRERLSTPTVEYDEDILFFYMSGQVFLMLKWCYDGFQLPLEEMVKKYLRLVHEPLLPPETD